jgi:hypothetical protein
MKDYPLEAIGKFFEMPNKEAWLNKIHPTLSFIYDNSLTLFGLVIAFFAGLAVVVYLTIKPRK